ncbi:MAG: peptidylprolyl isomerase [Myxococcales bacterium]|nr:peptidylprolyl isomerase [Myxococcales bacterium]
MALAGLSGSGTLWALIKTQRGVIDCELFPDDAPLTVANFVGLARGKRPFRDPRDPNATSWVTGRYYDGSSFHRVIPGFMIQGGDPTGTGTGSPGYVLVDEFSPDKIHDRPGVLSMSNIGQSNTGGAQFFITLNPTPHLDGIHTVFGQCSDAGVAIADDISLVPRDEHNKPEEDETIQRIDFEWRSPGDS